MPLRIWCSFDAAYLISPTPTSLARHQLANTAIGTSAGDGVHRILLASADEWRPRRCNEHVPFQTYRNGLNMALPPRPNGKRDRSLFPQIELSLCMAPKGRSWHQRGDPQPNWSNTEIKTTTFSSTIRQIFGFVLIRQVALTTGRPSSVPPTPRTTCCGNMEATLATESGRWLNLVPRSKWRRKSDRR